MAAKSRHSKIETFADEDKLGANLQRVHSHQQYGVIHKNGNDNKKTFDEILNDSKQDTLEVPEDLGKSPSMSFALRKNRQLSRRFTRRDTRRDTRRMSFFDRVRATIYSINPSENYSHSVGSSYISRKSTMHLARKNKKREAEKTAKLSKKKKEKVCKEWAHWSMLHHVGTYISILFIIFSAIFITFLYMAAVTYEVQLNDQVASSLTSDADFQMNKLINQTLRVCEKQFFLQDTLISKQAIILTELLGKKCAGDYHNPYAGCPDDESLREK